MPQKKKRRSSPVSRTRLPEGLDLARLTYRAPKLNLKDIYSALDGAHQRDKRDDGNAIRAVLRTPELLGAHAHFGASRSGAGEPWSIEYEIVRGTHGKLESRYLDAATYLQRTQHLFAFAESAALLSLHFVLPLERWKPPVSVPFSAPASIGTLPGNPTIAGMDFAFPETGTYGPRRIFVTTYQNAQQLVLRILLAYPPIWGPDLTSEIVKTARGFVTQLVTRRR